MWKQLSSLTKFIKPVLFAQQSSVLHNDCVRSFSVLTTCINRSVFAPMTISQLTASPLLQPTCLSMNAERGFKQMGRLKRRCKDCYFIRRFDRLLVLCKTHPRHKQMAMQKKPKNTWILTDATQSPLRAW